MNFRFFFFFGWPLGHVTKLHTSCTCQRLLLLLVARGIVGNFQNGGNFGCCFCSARSQYFGREKQSLTTRYEYVHFLIAVANLFPHLNQSCLVLLMRCSRIRVISSLGFLVVVLVSINVFLLSKLQYKESFSKEKALISFKVRS